VIHGVVNADLEATIRLHVTGPNGQRQEVTATSDTGYNGALSLPLATVLAHPIQGEKVTASVVRLKWP
jgi:hypothetical protein